LSNTAVDSKYFRRGIRESDLLRITLIVGSNVHAHRQNSKARFSGQLLAAFAVTLHLSCVFADSVIAATAPTDTQMAHNASALRDAALEGDTVAWNLVEGLTTEIGPRLAGTEQEARARDWAVMKLRALGFQNVHLESFDMPLWQRGEERAAIISPFPQLLTIAALGNSGPTPLGGVTAEVVAFDGITALIAAPPSAVKGKIVFVSHHMAAQQDGASYGDNISVRVAAPAIAAKKGAVAILIRSLGTDHHRVAHTGITNWPAGIEPIPAAALSVPDAEQLRRVMQRMRPVLIHINLDAHMAGTTRSANVVAEVPGVDRNASTLLVGGHLDSWDQGTGATDDGAGVAMVTAAAKRVMDSGTPLHTIRLVWFGAEEPGGLGGLAYANAHPNDTYMVAAESDRGADRIYSFAISPTYAHIALAVQLAEALRPLGITWSASPAEGETDVAPSIAAGAPAIDLSQDETRYLEIHHTPDDTLDKIDPAQLRQNVAAWTAMLAILANYQTPATAANE
jgi:carboxypeptidase Q